MITLYVDDLLIAGSNDKVIKSTKDMLKGLNITFIIDYDQIYHFSHPIQI